MGLLGCLYRAGVGLHDPDGSLPTREIIRWEECFNADVGVKMTPAVNQPRQHQGRISNRKEQIILRFNGREPWLWDLYLKSSCSVWLYLAPAVSGENRAEDAASPTLPREWRGWSNSELSIPPLTPAEIGWWL